MKAAHQDISSKARYHGSHGTFPTPTHSTDNANSKKNRNIHHRTTHMLLWTKTSTVATVARYHCCHRCHHSYLLAVDTIHTSGAPTKHQDQTKRGSTKKKQRPKNEMNERPRVSQTPSASRGNTT